MPHSITIIGASNIDITAQSLDKSGAVLGDSRPGQIAISAGGVGRNIAENLGRLGFAPKFISAFGDDDFNDLIRASLPNVDYSSSVISDGDSDCYLSLHDHEGEMTQAINQMSQIENITPSVIRDQADAIIDTKILVIESNLTPAALDEIAAILSASPKKSFVIAEAVSAYKCPRLIPHLPILSLIKCNRIEAQALTENPISSPKDLIKALHDQGVQNVILSLGADGFMASDGASTHHVEASPNQPIQANQGNVSGAGDALLSGFIAGLASDKSFAEAAQMAGRAATLTLSYSCAVHPDISLQQLSP